MSLESSSGRLRSAAASLIAVQGRPEPEIVQELLTALVGYYAGCRQSGADWSPLATGQGEMPATEVLLTVTKMLEAVDVEVFELGLWQSWGSV
ncbi:MAG: hypothetical protein GEU90_15205 [Gemmatimonas sp.]|nr:hypothetical protein [Gemmatimonas sp.]